MTPTDADAEIEAISAAAARWVARRETGLAAAEQRELDRWLAADPRHAAALRHYGAAWSALDRPGGAATDAVLRSLQARGRRRTRRRLAAVAAVCAAVFAVGLLRRDPPAPAAVPGPTVAAGASVLAPERRTLPDGSVVELRAGAELEVAFEPALRRVVLRRGEAHFAVTGDPRRPFVVAAGGVGVRAVGTAFSVDVAADRVAVLVTEGRIAVDRDAATAPVAFAGAGERVVVPRAGGAAAAVAALAGAEQAELLAWRRPRIEFSNTPLGEALALMNRTAAAVPPAPGAGPRLRLVVDPAEPALAAEPISGIFRADSAEALVRTLELSLGIEAELRGADEIVLRRPR